MTGVRPDLHGFWERAGATKTFTHALDPALLAAYVPRGARVLDYGCGYGRLTAQLAEAGYAAVGVDPSHAMVERGRAEHPGVELVHQAELPLPERDGAYDAALLFAVLNCVPRDASQHAAVAELARLVRPGGVLYVSEVPLQSDPRNVLRYEAHASGPDSGPYGTFTTPDGARFRHHTPEHLRALLDGHGFTVTEERTGTAPTLNGHTASRLQLVAHRRPAA